MECVTKTWQMRLIFTLSDTQFATQGAQNNVHNSTWRWKLICEEMQSFCSLLYYSVQQKYED